MPFNGTGIIIGLKKARHTTSIIADF